MNTSPFRSVALFFAGAALVLGLSGCGGPSREQLLQDANKNNGERLANAYSFYQNKNGAGPPDAETFKSFIQSEIPAELKKAMGIPSSNIEELFVSERDGKPFYIRPEVPRPNIGNIAQAVVIESEGSNGTIQVFFTGPDMVEAPASEAEAYKSGEKDVASGPAGSVPPELQP